MRFYGSLFTVRKRSCEKVMFSQACVKNSVHRGEVCTPRSDTSGQTHSPGRHPSPRQTATVADGMHPTGMHSCYHLQTKFAKVMFLHMCVCPQGGTCSKGAGGLVAGRVPAPWGVWSWGGLVPGGCLLQGCLVPGGGCSRGRGCLLRVGSGPRGLGCGDPPVTATAAGGTHPTGMHSCL